MTRRRIAIVLALVLLLALPACGRRHRGETVAWKPMPAAPMAAMRPTEITLHGDTRVDEYAWLRERDNAEVRQYLEAENAHTDAVMASTRMLQEQLFQEFVGRMQQADVSAPLPWGPYEYYSRTLENKEYGVVCRRPRGEEAGEVVLLDGNAMAEGLDYFALGNWSPSPNHEKLAYSVDSTGAWQYDIRVKNLRSGEVYPEVITGASGDVAWANDNASFLYCKLDAATRPYQVYHHVVGADPAGDTLVYHETDELFFLGVGRSRSGRLLYIHAYGHATADQRYASADMPTAEYRSILPRRDNVQYSVEDQGDDFIICTNDGAPNFRVLRMPMNNPVMSACEEILPHRDDTLIESAGAFAGFLAVTGRRNGAQFLSILDAESPQGRDVAFPESIFSYWLGENPEYDAGTLRLGYQSMVTPPSDYDYDVMDNAWVFLKQQPVPGYAPANYTTEQIAATAPDGSAVAVTLVYRKGLRRNGKNPCLLYGYGAYGFTMDPYFSSSTVSLLDRGFIYAVAHPRGESYHGRHWYENGKLLHKKNTFTDFIACAEALIAQGYTSKNKLVIWGQSAGGLLMGAVVNMRPDLFHACVAEVPFVDALNTMLDPTLPLTIPEYAEWGNPEDPVYYAAIKAYAPYENVHEAAYPHLLITGGINDSAVAYWEPAKWTARLRRRQTADRMLLFRCEMEAGHGGASGRFQGLRDQALLFAFMLHALELP